MKHLAYGIKYLANYWFFGKTSPLICGIVLHNKCNLRCRHCTIVDRPPSALGYEEAVTVMDSFYAEGGRCLYLEGGEPMIWHDNSHGMEDVVQYAKKKGYFAVIIYTNGTRPLESASDTIFVSVDGLRDTHEICSVYEDGKYYKCCRDNNNGEVCKDCGYLSYPEIDQVLKLNPGAIVNALKYF